MGGNYFTKDSKLYYTDENVKNIEIPTTVQTLTLSADGSASVQGYKREKEVPEDVKTILNLDDDTDSIVINVFEGGYKIGEHSVIPDVNYIEVINDRVIIVYFCDGTTEKAVLAKNDTFSLENGLSICLTKKLLSKVSNGNGSSVYNKLIEYMIKTYEQQVEMERIEDEELKAFKEREEKKIVKAKAKREKRLNAIREEQIEIQKEAYIRAMRELNKPTPEEQA